MNVSLTHRGEVIMMLCELYKSLPKNPEVKQLMEENKITHLVNVCPSSVEFVLKEAIKELGGAAAWDMKGDAEHGTLEGNDRGAAADQAGD